jgi:hypothetical protein
MSGSPSEAWELPSDPTLRAMLERGIAAARRREGQSAFIEAAQKPDTASTDAEIAASRLVRLSSNRACVESNLARKGLWRPAPARRVGQGASGGEFVRLLDASDQMGLVQRIDSGPPLGALAFDVAVWACSRWRERGDRSSRHVPLTLEGLAGDLGWRKGGGAAAELARTLDALRLATFRARIYNARLSETRIDTFGLLDRWERGDRHRDGRAARPGFLVLGDWLHEQLVRGHVTFLDWSELRALRSGTARRLLVYLDAERFSGCTWRRVVDPGLLTTLGIVAARAKHQRVTLRRAATEVTTAPNRYVRVALEPGERRGEHALVAQRRERVAGKDQGSWRGETGQSRR